MSQISDYVDNAGANATDDRVLGFAVVATSRAVHASALAALEAGQTAQDAVRFALAEGAVLTWTPPADVAAVGASLIETSFRGHIVFTPDTDEGRALLATLRLADELPFSSTDEAAFHASLEACADVSVRDVRAGADLDALLGADVEPRIARMHAPASPASMQTEGDAVIVIDRIGNVAIATTGPTPFIVDRSGMPWLAGAVRGESVLTPASFLHAVIDRAAPLDEAVPRAAGMILAAISHELYRDAFVGAALPDALAQAERGDPPPKAPMPARGQNFTIGPAGHDG